jgi:ice-binding like protein
MRTKFTNKMWITAVFLGISLTGCGGDGGSPRTTPTGGVSAADTGTATTGGVCVGAACVNLGAAANYAILAKTGVATSPISVVTGNVGLSPTARVGLTGWSLITEPTDTFFTSAQVAAPGKLYAADNVGGTTSVDLTTAVGNMGGAYTAAAAKPATSAATTNLLGGTLTDQNLAPGVYEWGTAVNIPTNLTLTGSATDVWVFKVAGTLDMAAAKNVILSGGALAKNIFWQVAGAVTIGANSHFEGIVLGQTSITLGNLASINGRLLAQTAIILDATTVTVP